MPLLGRTKRYDAGQVRHLRAATLAWPFAGFGRWNRAAYPPWFANAGSDPFDYGARTVRVLPGLDEAEGRMVAGSEAVRRTMAGEAVAGGGGGVAGSRLTTGTCYCVSPLSGRDWGFSKLSS
jgi:hypothetical protein